MSHHLKFKIEILILQISKRNITLLCIVQSLMVIIRVLYSQLPSIIPTSLITREALPSFQIFLVSLLSRILDSLSLHFLHLWLHFFKVILFNCRMVDTCIHSHYCKVIKKY